MAQRRLSEAEVELDRRSWETNEQIETQRLELLQANQWADQAQRETNRLLGELSTKKISQKITEKLRNCGELAVQEAERARQLRSDELSTQKEESKSTVNQLLSQIQELQDNVNSFNDAMIPRQRAALEYPTFPVNPREFRFQEE